MISKKLYKYFNKVIIKKNILKIEKKNDNLLETLYI